MSTRTWTDDNESCTLTVVTTVGESGLDPSTDGSASPDVPVRLSVCVWHGGRRAAIEAMGCDLPDALAGRAPRWRSCPGLCEREIEHAIERIAPGADDLLISARLCLAEEDRAAAEGGDDAWLDTMMRSRDEIGRDADAWCRAS